MTRRGGLTAVAGVVALAALATGGWLWAAQGDGGYHEHVTVAARQPPSVPAPAVPENPSTAYPATSDTYDVVGPWSLDQADDGDGTAHGIVAHDLRTGKAYWRYTRDGVHIGELSVTDTAAGGAGSGTVAVWWPDGLLVSLDLATGAPRWRHKVPYAEGSEPVAGLTVAGDLVLAGGADSVTAYGARSGATVWTAKAPRGCTFTNSRRFTMTHLVVAEASCGSAKTVLAGYDTARGTLRWTVDAADLASFVPDGHTLVLYSLGAGPRTREVVDVSGAEPVRQPWPVRAPLNWVAAGGGLALGSAGDGGNALTAYDVAGARERWTARPAQGTRFGEPLLVGNRVYVVQQPLKTPLDPAGGRPAPGAGYHADLLVLDAATGKQLHDGKVPPLPMDPDARRYGASATLDVRHVGSGMVAIGWRGMGAHDTTPSMALLGQ